MNRLREAMRQSVSRELFRLDARRQLLPLAQSADQLTLLYLEKRSVYQRFIMAPPLERGTP